MTTYIRPFTNEERIAAPLRKGTKMFYNYYYETHVNGYTKDFRRVVALNSIMMGVTELEGPCSMKKPYARLHFLLDGPAELIVDEYATKEEAKDAENNRKTGQVARNLIWEYIERRVYQLGKPIPSDMEQLFRMIAAKGDVLTRSYMSFAITKEECKEYYNEFWELTGKEAL